MKSIDYSYHLQQHGSTDFNSNADELHTMYLVIWDLNEATGNEVVSLIVCKKESNFIAMFQKFENFFS